MKNFHNKQNPDDWVQSGLYLIIAATGIALLVYAKQHGWI